MLFYKRKIRRKVYSLYLRGYSVDMIGAETKLTHDEVNEIIDYMNELFPNNEEIFDEPTKKENDRYSVSLVYSDGREALLRVLITSASSSEEALGKAINEFKEETKNHHLSMEVVIKIKE